MRVLYAALLTVLSAAPVAAQSYYGQTSHGQSYAREHSGARHYNSGHGRGYSNYDYQGQRDVPGDYRCDAYWDRGRTDCDAGWRDQRRYASRGAYRYGDGHGRRDHRYYNSNPHRGGYGGSEAATAFYGAYGRPDLVYPGGGHGQAGYGHAAYGQRNPGRVDWCRAQYRSYDPSSGYYRTYSGRLIYCG